MAILVTVKVINSPPMVGKAWRAELVEVNFIEPFQAIEANIIQLHLAAKLEHLPGQP